MLYLKQSTACTLKIGPFLDDTDGVTAETALTISQADVRLSKNGGDLAQKSDSSAASHDEIGIYDLDLDATDTGTVGRLQLFVAESGALPVWHEYMVLPANVYDALMGTDALQVHATEISNDLITAAAIATGALDADALAADAAAEIADAVWNEATADHTTAGSASQALIDVLADTNELQADDTPAAIAALNDPTAADVADAVWNEALADHTGSGSTGEALDAAGGSLTAGAIADAVWDEALSGHTTTGTAGAKLTTAAAGDAGAGAITYTYTLTNSVDSSPIADADVWLTTDQAGTNVIASGRTDANGQTVFYLDAGTIYVWRQKSGYNFTNPQTDTVA